MDSRKIRLAVAGLVVVIVIVLWAGRALREERLFLSPLPYAGYLPSVSSAQATPECPDKPVAFGVCRQKATCAEVRALNPSWVINSGGDQYELAEWCGYEWRPYLAYPFIVADWERRPYTPREMMFGNEWNHKHYGVEPDPPEAAALMLPVIQDVVGAGGEVWGPFPAWGDNAWWAAFWQEYEALAGELPDWRQVKIGVHCYQQPDDCEGILWDAAETFAEVFDTPRRWVAGHAVPVEAVVVLGEHGQLSGDHQTINEADAGNNDLWTRMYFGDMSAVVAHTAYWSLKFDLSHDVPCPDLEHCWIPAYRMDGERVQPIWDSLCSGPRPPTSTPSPTPTGPTPLTRVP